MSWWALWAVLGVVALIGESFSLALFLLNIAAAAFVVAVLALVGAAVAVQIGAFVVLSILLVGLARPRMVQALTGRRGAPELPAPGAVVNRLATVKETITADGGSIQVGKGEFWSARMSHAGADIEVGRRVRVTEVSGLTALVEPLAEPLPETPATPATSAPSALDLAQEQPVLAESVPPSSQKSDCAPPTFGALLKRHRAAAGLTQEELAERARLSVRAISDLERGLHRAPQKDTIALIADALGLSPEDRAAFVTAARRSSPTQSAANGASSPSRDGAHKRVE